MQAVGLARACDGHGLGAKGKRRKGSLLSGTYSLGLSSCLCVSLCLWVYRTKNPKGNGCRQGGTINHLQPVNETFNV